MQALSDSQAVKGERGSVAVLDIGSSKIACFIAQPDEQQLLHITGIGHNYAQGLRGSVITDSALAEQSIAKAVDLAEQMAGVQIDNVMVSIALSGCRSQRLQIELNIAGNAVSDQDVYDILQEACRLHASKQTRILHCFVTHYQLDGAKNIRDPRGMYGMILRADVHIITISDHALLNMAASLSRCHLDIAGFILSPYASGLGCLERDERDLGVALIDMAAMETGCSLFQHGANVYTQIIPLGGYHVTKDIAQGLSTTISTAERIKTLYGSVLASADDDKHMIYVPRIGEEEEGGEEAYVTHAELMQIIRPRLEETFDLLADNIESASSYRLSDMAIVLTGGASQLVGVREMAVEIFNTSVRIGKPLHFPGLAESCSGPHFSTAVGMLHYVQHSPFEDSLLNGRFYGQDNAWSRFTQWLRRNVG